MYDDTDEQPNFLRKFDLEIGVWMTRGSALRNVKLNVSYDFVVLLLPGSLYCRRDETQLNAPSRPFWRSAVSKIGAARVKVSSKQ